MVAVGRLVEHLRGHGERLAVAGVGEQLSYRELADRIDSVGVDFGPTRRLILLETRNNIETLVHYLAALEGGHVVMPVPAGADHSTIISAYDPDVTIDHTGRLYERRTGSTHTLHPDLALLMSTSGSTGSSKMVRQSRYNLIANAVAIAMYLDICEDDRALTTLPMSYCYGLSVIHSHLLRGAGLILTSHSVVDEEFWELFGRFGATTFAGVPYTFELLDRIGFEHMQLPTLRYITQAGGHLPPERVRHFATLGQRRGWKLFVMYGATESTSRMAYLPPELALSHPSAIGRPIPGGSFAIESVEDWSEPHVGELVYRGPNVMLGYAHDATDLALGRTVDALHTGDIARLCDDGLYELVGRASRFAKIFGLRIDLQRLEGALSSRGMKTFCVESGGRLAIAATDRHSRADIAAAASASSGLPLSVVRVVKVSELPLLPSGKPDYPAVRTLTGSDFDDPSADIRGLFVGVLGVDPESMTPDATFVGLGGNSLSYVTMSIRMERLLGTLPAGWQDLTVGELERRRRSRPWFGATVDTSVALRAVAIVLILTSHAHIGELWGGAHILLGIAGYNFGRFCLTGLPRADRARHLRRTIAAIAGPAVAWVAVVLLFTDDYHLSNLLLANKILGPFDSVTGGFLWFVEVLVWTLVVLTLVCCSATGDRLERRFPFLFAASFLAIGLMLRYDVFGFDLGKQAWFTYLTFWFFAVGWAAAKASTLWQRILVTAVLLVSLVGYFGDTQREILVGTALVALIWIPAIRCPRHLALVAGLLAEASLYTYLTHYQVYDFLFPTSEYSRFDDYPVIGVVAGLGFGIALTYLVSVVRTKVAAARRQHRRRGSARRGSA